MIKILKKFLISTLAFVSLVSSANLFSFDVSGESFPANFNMTSWIAGENGSTITSEGTVGEGYGKVYLTHNFTVGSDDGMSGEF